MVAMATATIIEAPEAGDLPARLEGIVGALSSVAADLHPASLSGPQATELFSLFARTAKLVDAGRTLLAARIKAAEVHLEDGYSSPATLLAHLSGEGIGDARTLLETAEVVGSVPDLERAVRSGHLSHRQTKAIANAARVDPAATGDLLETAEEAPLDHLRVHCRHVRASASVEEPEKAARRIHHERYLKTWYDDEGAFCFKGSTTADRGPAFMQAVTLLCMERFREGLKNGALEDHSAYMVDALLDLVASRTCSDVDTRQRPATTLVVRVDLDVLRTGSRRSTDICEIDGAGPVPPSLIASLCSDTDLWLAFHKAGDIRSISHQGRNINSNLRAALFERDHCCVVPGCSQRNGLEIDHLVPWSAGGRTEFDNLARVCHHHHALKTFEGWTLTRVNPGSAPPKWTFKPPPRPRMGLGARFDGQRWKHGNVPDGATTEGPAPPPEDQHR